jgi:hypothetical protein
MNQQGRTGKLSGFLVATMVLFSAAFVSAADFKGVSFPDELTIGAEKCSLNGIGIRKKFFIDVYYGAFYAKDKVGDAAAAVESDQPKAVVIHVIYKQVDADKWVEGWKEGFAKNTPHPDPSLRERMETFMGWFNEPVKKGEEVRLLYEPGEGTHVVIKGVEKGVVPGADFMQALWKIYFGEHPASDDLKKAMLGQS